MHAKRKVGIPSRLKCKKLLQNKYEIENIQGLGFPQWLSLCKTISLERQFRFTSQGTAK